MAFTDSYLCKSRKHCKICRESAEWRKQVAAPSECPFSLGVGDFVEGIAKPVADLLDKTLKTKFSDCSGCARRKKWLNDKFKKKN